MIAAVALSNPLPFADVPGYVEGLLLETLLECCQPTYFMPLFHEAKDVSIQGSLRMAYNLHDDQLLGTSHKPLKAYTGRYVRRLDFTS